jgi:hypothetical protein
LQDRTYIAARIRATVFPGPARRREPARRDVILRLAKGVRPVAGQLGNRFVWRPLNSLF